MTASSPAGSVVPSAATAARCCALSDSLLATSGIALKALDAIGVWPRSRRLYGPATGRQRHAGFGICRRTSGHSGIGSACPRAATAARRRTRAPEYWSVTTPAWARCTGPDFAAAAATPPPTPPRASRLPSACSRQPANGSVAGRPAVPGPVLRRTRALSVLRMRLAPVRDDIHPRAQEIAVLAAHDGLEAALPPEQALPAYVRDNVATVPGSPGGRRLRSPLRCHRFVMHCG